MNQLIDWRHIRRKWAKWPSRRHKRHRTSPSSSSSSSSLLMKKVSKKNESRRIEKFNAKCSADNSKLSLLLDCQRCPATAFLPATSKPYEVEVEEADNDHNDGRSTAEKGSGYNEVVDDDAETDLLHGPHLICNQLLKPDSRNRKLPRGNRLVGGGRIWSLASCLMCLMMICMSTALILTATATSDHLNQANQPAQKQPQQQPLLSHQQQHRGASTVNQLEVKSHRPSRIDYECTRSEQQQQELQDNFRSITNPNNTNYSSNTTSNASNTTNSNINIYSNNRSRSNFDKTQLYQRQRVARRQDINECDNCIIKNNILTQLKSAWNFLERKWRSSKPMIIFAEANPDANRLYEDLMMTYNRIVRPVQNNSDRVVVRLGLKLSQLIDVEWTDYKLKWDPSEYGGILDINVPAEQIWLPDIALYNSAEGYFAVSIMTKAKVRYDGHVMWNPPAIFRSSCQIDITYFPFDSQNCHLKFGSWTFGAKLDLRHINDTEQTIERGTDLSEYYQNVEWDIMQATAKRNVKTYICCPNDFYPDVTFNFTLRRKPLFYTVNLILPCVGITILSFLVFYLPSDSGEKVTLTISILVSLIFFLSVLIETIPSTSLAMPLLGKYLVFTMILITLSVCATVCVLNIHFRTPSTHSMPAWIKLWCIEILPKFLFMNVPHYQSQQANVLPEQLIYLHNQAYSNQAGVVPDPMTNKLIGDQWDLIQSYLAPLSSLNGNNPLSNAPAYTNDIPANNTSQRSGKKSRGDKKKKRKSKKDNKLNSSCSVELDASKLPNSASGALATAGSSSLFLPYLQSEAARRLKMQRSRSSDRENKSSSDYRPLSGCGNSGNSSHLLKHQTTFDEDCDTSMHRQTSINGMSRQMSGRLEGSTLINMPTPSPGASKSREKKTSQKKSSSFLFGLFSSSKSTESSKSSKGRRRHKESSSSGSSRHSGGQAQNSRDSGATGDNNEDDDNPEDEYQHHQHFQARASICSTNLWRIGPTRRCSMAVPANYPTYYRPQIQVHNHMHLQPIGSDGNPAPISTVSGCMQHGHYHTHGDYSASSEPTSDLQDPRGAIGVLASAAVGSSMIRPKQQQHPQQQAQEIQHLGPNLMMARNIPVINNQQPSRVNLPANSSLQPNSSQSNQYQLQQQAQLSGQFRSSNSNGHFVGLKQVQQPFISSTMGHNQMIRPTSLYNNQGQHALAPQYQTQQYMPRSRSTDHRLSAIYSQDMPSPQVPVQYQQQQTWTNQKQLQNTMSFVNGSAGIPSTSQQHQQSLSIGRALGQAYVQRLQRQPTIYSMQMPTSSQRPSRPQQRGVNYRPSSSGTRILLTPGNDRIIVNSPSYQESFERMRRSRSQNSLDHHRHHHQQQQQQMNRVINPFGAMNTMDNCEQCNSLRRTVAGNNSQQFTLRHRLNSTGCNRQQQQQHHANNGNSCSCQQHQGAHHIVRPISSLDGFNEVKQYGYQVQARDNCTSCGAHSYNRQKKMHNSSVARVHPPPLTTMSLLKLISEVDKAIQNGMFIAQHIDNLDEFESVKENWKYIAMVIDRIFLIVFLFACIVGTFCIFAMVPWSYYKTEKPIDLHLAKIFAMNLSRNDNPGGEGGGGGGGGGAEITPKPCQQF